MSERSKESELACKHPHLLIHSPNAYNTQEWVEAGAKTQELNPGVCKQQVVLLLEGD